MSFIKQEQSSFESSIGRALPANLEAERSVLSAILLNDENLSLVSDILEPVDFYNKANQTIYQAIFDLAQANKKIDIVILKDSLESRHQLDEVGGISYLIELQEDIPAIGLIDQYAKIIKDKAILRSLITSATHIISSCYNTHTQDISEVLDIAEKKIFQISHKLTSSNFVPLNQVLKKTFQNLANVKSAHEGITGVPSGFNQFDKMTSGMQPGDLLIMAARPSMGKTALAISMALNAWHAGHAIGIFSLEMSAEQLVLRMLSSESGIAHQKIRNAMISSDEWGILIDTAAKLAEAGIFIDDSANINILELRAKARKLKSKSNIQLLIVDYLQLINSHQRHENRTQEISLISRSLKALAKELNVPVLAISQLSRSLESRMDKRPLLSDLRESGAIEQDGDVIFFIYRDSAYNSDVENPEVTELIIGKQRNGPVGTAYIRSHFTTTSFQDIEDMGHYRHE